MSNVFDEHLDHCEQCAHHPFDLCSVGAVLLRQAAMGLTPTGRSPSEPVLQRMPLSTKAERDTARGMKPPSWPAPHFDDLSEVEQRVGTLLHHSEHSRPDPLCILCLLGQNL